MILNGVVIQSQQQLEELIISFPPESQIALRLIFADAMARGAIVS